MQIGTKVKLVKPVENYPTCLIEAGETGTLARIDEDSYWVTLDTDHPELDEWQNQVQIFDWSDYGEQPDEHPSTYLAEIGDDHERALHE